jgi:hypothetical protein
LPNVSPQFFVRIKPKWKYKLTAVEIVGYGKSSITRPNLFAENRFWLSDVSVESKSNLQRLIAFGLSKKEAKTWLSKEPNYHDRRKVTEEKNRRKGNSTQHRNIKIIGRTDVLTNLQN